MYVSITITAVANRDESCNLFTLTETHNFRVSDTPDEQKIKTLLEQHKVKFLDMWPHHRQAKPVLVPLDATVEHREGRMP